MRRVYRDFTILLAAPRLTQAIYKDMLKPFGFKSIEMTHEDQQAISLMKKLKPHLMISTMSLSVFTGPQLLSVSRDDPSTSQIPFLIFGVKEDEKRGNLSDHIGKDRLARFIGMPTEDQAIVDTIDELLEHFVDPVKEEAYTLSDDALDAYKSGNFEAAADKYRQSLDLNDDNTDAWLKLASTLTELEDFDEAEVAYFKALGLNQYSFVAYLGLAEMYERRDDLDLTVGILRQALQLASSLKVSSASVARINFFIGEFELRLKRLTTAEESFSKAVEQDPESAELREDIGDAYAEKGYFEESEKYYEAAIDMDPNLAHVFNKLGIAYRKQSKFQKALILYEKARAHHPSDEHLMFNIARAHYEDIRHNKAMEVLQEALELSPNFKAAKSMVAKLRGELSHTELDDFEDDSVESFDMMEALEDSPTPGE